MHGRWHGAVRRRAGPTDATTKLRTSAGRIRCGSIPRTSAGSQRGLATNRREVDQLGRKYLAASLDLQISSEEIRTGSVMFSKLSALVQPDAPELSQGEWIVALPRTARHSRS